MEGADQLQGNHAAVQHLCFCNIDSTIHLFHNFQVSSLKPSSVAIYSSACVRPGLNPRDRFSHDAADLISWPSEN